MTIARFLLLRFCLGIVVVTALAACATAPKDTVQRLYVAEWTIAGGANAIADLKPVLKSDDYEQAKAIIFVMNDALSCGKASAGLKVESMPAACPVLPSGQSGALGYLQLINANLLKLSAYYAAKGQ